MAYRYAITGWGTIFRIFPGCTEITRAARAAIQRSEASIPEVSRGYGVNPTTVAKWMKRNGLRHAREQIRLRKEDYNPYRSHSSLGNLTLRAFAMKSALWIKAGKAGKAQKASPKGRRKVRSQVKSGQASCELLIGPLVSSIANSTSAQKSS